MQTEIIQRIADKLRRANMIYIVGNGGSAAQADHFACDLLKGCNLPTISLCSNQALITSLANDVDFSNVFTDQLKVLFRDGDVLIVLSTRGGSPNIVVAAKYVYLKQGGMVIGVAGFDGGELKEWSHIFYHIDSYNMQICEDEMAKLCHEIYNYLRL